jgi:hypothetical protein
MAVNRRLVGDFGTDSSVTGGNGSYEATLSESSAI